MFNSLRQFEYTLEHARNLPNPEDVKQLRHFDSSLNLWFSERKNRWFIVQTLEGNRFSETIMCLEDELGNPIPFSNRILVKLWNMRAKVETKSDWNKYFDKIALDQRIQEEKDREDAYQTTKEIIIDDITTWRKAAKEVNNEAPSDVTAGYQYNPKPKTKGKVCSTR